MPLTKLQFKPGINREVTAYSNEGGWIDCDKIRFRFGYPEKIGGWEKYSNNTYLGTARRLHSWIALDGSKYLGLGTNLKYYIEEGGSYKDITPLRGTTPFTNALGNDPITTNDTVGTEKQVTINDTNHGAVEGDFVTLSGVNATVGGVGASILNAEHQITTVTNGNSYIITVSVDATSDATGGGNSVVAVYQINTGLDSGVGGTGWSGGMWGGQLIPAQTNTINMGSGLSDIATTITLTSSTGFPSNGGVVLIGNELITYNGISTNDLTGCVRGMYLTTASTHSNGATVTDATTGWGMPSSTTTTTELRTWSHDNFGEDLIINPRDSAVYYWDRTLGLSSRAVNISTLTKVGGGASSNCPTVAKQVIVSDNDRHIIAFGTNTYGTSTQDPLMIRWSTQADPANWEITSTTTAGSLRLGSGSEFVQAVETKREIIVFTDTSVFSMRFIGDPLIFGLQTLASNITIVGSKSAVATEDFVFWMGLDNFYVYTGQTQQLPCSVKDKVFNDFNLAQREKVVAGINSEFSEVIWYYPSQSNSIANGGNGDNDKYVVYNYAEKVWYYGSLTRTAWIDRGIKSFPIGASSNYLYNHELGFDDDGSPINSYIESAPMDIGDGDKFTLISKIIPDLTFNGSTSLSNPSAIFSVKTRNFPGTNFHETTSGTTTRTSTVPVEQFTNELDIRARGRSFAMRVESNASGMKWKLGSPRVEIRTDGRR